MPVINGIRDNVGIGFPPGDRVNIDTEGEWLECPVCGRQALATEWPEVLFSKDGTIPRVCPDCDRHNLHSVPVPVESRPWAPKVGDLCRYIGINNALRGLACRVRDLGGSDKDTILVEFETKGRYLVDPENLVPPVNSTAPPATLYTVEEWLRRERDGGKSHAEGLDETPDVPVAAVVVRGLGGGETARVVLCRSEIEAAREQQRNGGVVIAAGQIHWA